MVRDHGPWLFRYLRWMGCQAQDVEDTMQDVFVVVWTRGFERRGASQTRAYVREVARRIALDRLRRSKPPSETRQLEDYFDAREADRDLRLEALQSCLGTLAPRARRALQMFHGEGEDRARIGTALGLRLGGVKKLLARARSSLRSCIEKRVRDEEQS